MFKFVLINFIKYSDNNVLVKNESYGSCKVKKLLKYCKNPFLFDTKTMYDWNVQLGFVHSGFDFIKKKNKETMFFPGEY